MAAETIDLEQFIVPLVLVGFALLAVAVALYLVMHFKGLAQHDRRDAVRKAVLAVMLQNPRFGVSRNTPLPSVGLRCEFLGKGTGVDAVKCWLASGAPFVQDDFKGCAPSYFGGVDYVMDVPRSRLFVFFTIEAKSGYFEHMRKGG